jgi:hypothetical protein
VGACRPCLAGDDPGTDACKPPGGAGGGGGRADGWPLAGFHLGFLALKRLLSVVALLAVTACGGVLESSALAAVDGGASCLTPTVMPVVTPPGGTASSGLVEVDLGEVTAGLDPVVLDSVRLRPASGLVSLASVEGAWLSVPGEPGAAGVLLAGAPRAVDVGLVLTPARLGTDLRPFASGGRLLLRLQMKGEFPDGAKSVTLEVCLGQPIQHAVL